MNNYNISRLYDYLKVDLENIPRKHSTIVERARAIAAFIGIKDVNEIDQAIKEYEEHFPATDVSEADVLLADNSYGNWFYAKKVEVDKKPNDGFFKRYKSFLLKKDFDGKVVEQLEKDCQSILKQCANPMKTLDSSERKKKGLVMGDVQSGKTSNYLGLINMACDYGYSLFVILAGTTDSLRRQTQDRIDEGFIGVKSDSIGHADIQFYGVGLLEDERKRTNYASILTNKEKDFVKFKKDNLNFTSTDFNKPVVMVIKKNSKVLEQVVEWLSSGGFKGKSTIIIDDEADNASVNTKKPEEDPSRINSYIRDLFNFFDIATYIGYTATPFANIFIDTEDGDNEDLFPSDFIVLLNSNTNYFGAEKVFEYNGTNDSRYIRILDEAEPNLLPAKHKKNEYKIHTLPDSLKESILCFLINNVILTLRGKDYKHRTEMINISVYNTIQNDLLDKVSDYVDYLNDVILQDSYKDTDDFIRNKDLKKLYVLYYNDPFYSQLNKQYSFEDIKNGLAHEVDLLETVIINSLNKKDRFRYPDETADASGKRVIVIGGYVLSRGLTLEGLMISYYNRNSNAYDSLLQMCRWFGYRNGYEDLCRLYISHINLMCFRAVTEAVEDLKRQLREMIVKGKKPIDFGLMVRESPESLETASLLVTNRNKMRFSKEIVHQINYGGAYPDTSKLFFSSEINKKNIKSLKGFIEKSGKTWTDYSITSSRRVRKMLFDIDKNIVSNFISSLIIPYENMKFDTENLSRYIKDSTTFTKWDAVIVEGDSDKYFEEIQGIRFKCVRRKFRFRPNESFVRIGDSNNRILDPNSLSSGLSDNQMEIVRKNARDRVEKSNKSKSLDLIASDYLHVDRKPLLVIYPIDLQAPDDGINESKILDKMDNTIPLLGFAIGFPFKEGGEKMKYRVNQVKIREIEKDRYDDVAEIEEMDDEY